MRARIVAWAPPVRDVRFWVVQVLILTIAAGHTVIESSAIIDLGHANFVPVSLFLLPVVYAALAFGLRGSAPTGLWCAALTVPNVALFHDSSDIIGEIWQAGLVVAVGFFVGHRIDRERAAQADAVRRQREQRASEDKYRTVFDSAGDAILLLDEDSAITDANAAAGELLGEPHSGLRGRLLQDVAPPDIAAAGSLGTGHVLGPLVVTGRHPRWLVPVRTRVEDASGHVLTLLLLRDVTLQVERQQLLEGFAAQTLAALEEERRRIARELHDGPLQSLVLLWRNLDQLEAQDGQTPVMIADARATAERVGAELRRFSRDLRPSVLDDLGLSAALRAETSAFAHRTGIRARYYERGATHGLDAEAQLAVLRVCQEALHNIERHAAASVVSVRISGTGTSVELKVADNGTGLAHLPRPADLVAAGRLGLVGMQERARLVRGTCAISGSSSGTTVRFTAPIAASSRTTPDAPRSVRRRAP